MATKPTDLPEWASGNLGQTPSITEPSATKQAKGWIAEKPSAAFLNWWMNLVYTWMVYLDAFLTDAHTWVGLQTFTNATFTNDPTLATRTGQAVGAGSGGSFGSGWALASIGLPAKTYTLPGGEVRLVGSIITTSGSPAATSFTLATALRPGNAAAGQRTFRVVATRSATQVAAFMTIVASTGAVLIAREDGAAWISGDTVYLDGVSWNTTF
jgi:hypothetical protein